VNLRPHQLRGLTEASRAFAEGARSVLMVAPTGSGKTLMCATAVRNHLAADLANQVLWLAHRRELVEQSEDTLRSLGVGSACTVDTVQSAIEHRPAYSGVTLVVLDEARHYVSDEWSRVRFLFPNAKYLGADATPERQDGRGLGQLFDRMVVCAQPGELLDQGILVDCVVRRPHRPLDPGQIAQDPVEAYLRETPGEQGILFARSVADAERYAAAFEARGVRTACVSADTPDEERAQRVGLFRDGLLTVLTNVQVLTEGFDAPAASVCVLARGCSSPGAYLQMVGRVLRSAPGKDHATLLDLRGVSHEHGHPLADREYSLDGKAIRLPGYEGEACRACNAIPCQCPDRDADGRPLRVVGVELESWQDRVAALPEVVHVRMLAKWIREARAKGYKLGWAFMRFRGSTRRAPSPGLIRKALEASRA
jgi:DNA repair protein RadD